MCHFRKETLVLLFNQELYLKWSKIYLNISFKIQHPFIKLNHSRFSPSFQLIENFSGNLISWVHLQQPHHHQVEQIVKAYRSRCRPPLGRWDRNRTEQSWCLSCPEERLEECRSRRACSARGWSTAADVQCAPVNFF